MVGENEANEILKIRNEPHILKVSKGAGRSRFFASFDASCFDQGIKLVAPLPWGLQFKK